jgi:hypothetical protein
MLAYPVRVLLVESTWAEIELGHAAIHSFHVHRIGWRLKCEDDQDRNEMQQNENGK